MKPRVAILADYALPDGGAPKVAVESARALAEAGHRVHYLHAVGEAADPLLDHPAIETVGFGEASVWESSGVAGAIRGLWNREAAARLARELAAREGPDLAVHLHQWTKAFSPAIFATLRRRGRPWAITLHDHFLACPTGAFYRFDRAEPCDLRPLSAACLTARCDPRSSAHKAVRIARSAILRRTLAGAAFHAVHVSELGRRTIAPFLPPGARQRLIANPVRIARGAPAALPADGPALYVGRFTREKGADIAAAAAARAGWPALFVGEGPAEAAIRAAHPGAEIVPWAPPAEIDRLLRSRARALLAPSRWPETGPLTVFEAMAAGVPVVGSTLSGAAERLTDGVTGHVVAPTPEANARALDVLAGPGRAAAMGAAAFDDYWARPQDFAAHAADLGRLYGDMLDAQD